MININCKNKWLHLFYSLVYLKICIFFAYIHLLKHSDDYLQVLNVTKLDAKALNDLISIRGLRKEIERASLNEIILNTGIY